MPLTLLWNNVTYANISKTIATKLDNTDTQRTLNVDDGTSESISTSFTTIIWLPFHFALSAFLLKQASQMPMKSNLHRQQLASQILYSFLLSSWDC